MSEESSGCGCCPDCTGEPDCTCCEDCMCGYYEDDCCCCDDHDHCCDDCCCEESRFVLSAVSSIVGMLFLGTLAILYSILYMNNVWEVPKIVAADYSFLLFCVAAILTFIGIIAFKAGDMTEGMLFFLGGLSAVVANGAVLFGFGTVAYLDMVITVMLFVVALILFAGRDITFGISVIAIAVGFAFATCLSGYDAGLIAACIAYLIGGILLLYVAISDWLFVETGVDLPIL